MLVLGLSGGLDLAHQSWFAGHHGLLHDSAAVLVEDGALLAAAEQERFDRIKHSNRFPLDAIRLCLSHVGVRLAEVAAVAYYSTAASMAGYAATGSLDDLSPPRRYDTRELLIERFRQCFDAEIETRLFPVHHHGAHALSACALSGFDDSLVLTLDGAGDGLSGTVSAARGSALTTLAEFPADRSLGAFYQLATEYFGFGLFDEYKVMGLAPYGDPARFRPLFAELYRLLPEGEYTLNALGLGRLAEVSPVRAAGEPLEQVHKDVAAALQETLEAIVLHIARHWRNTSGLRDLCFAGGVAQNSRLNGVLLRSGLFERIYVPPAAHDAGCALGAALAPFSGEGARSRPGRLRHALLGLDVGDGAEIEAALGRWDGLVSWRRVADVCEETAALLAQERVVGWVQGRAEFGPRALGNRSILADPRRAETRDLVNALVKRREAFRPLAPAVPEERLAEFFDLPAAEAEFAFMSFVLPVRAERRPWLGAVTHVDGTARPQAVSRTENPRFWELLHAFERRTGLPVLLNTSFNADAEPIVNSVDDAVACFLTTGLHDLVVGDYVVARCPDALVTGVLGLVPALPAHVVLNRSQRPLADGRRIMTFALQDTGGRSHDLSAAAHALLERADGHATLGRLLDTAGLSAAAQATLVSEVVELWSRRFIYMRPRLADTRPSPAPNRSGFTQEAPSDGLRRGTLLHQHGHADRTGERTRLGAPPALPWPEAAGPATKAFRDGTHRLRPPEETLARVRRFLPAMGITRIANVTGLDTIGIPVVMVCRPNSRSLAVSQGKALDLATAKASGVMESIELYHAERIALPLKLGSYEDLRYTHRLADVDALPRTHSSRYHPDLPLLWIEAHDLLSGGPAWLPFEAVHTNYTLPLPAGSGCFAMTGNGLASGNHLLEALCHALCEAIERDATTLWHLLHVERRGDTRLDPATVDDPACREALARFDRAGVDVAVWETTGDAGVPSFLCMIAERDPSPLRRLLTAAGMGCHPAREVALLRALTEAAQSRLTFISGARDDMYRRDYERYRAGELQQRQRLLMQEDSPRRSFHDVPTHESETFDDDLAWLLERLHRIGVRQALAVNLTRPEFRLPVVRVVVPGLEGPEEKLPGYVHGERARAFARSLLE